MHNTELESETYRILSYATFCYQKCLKADIAQMCRYCLFACPSLFYFQLKVLCLWVSFFNLFHRTPGMCWTWLMNEETEGSKAYRGR